MADLAALLVEEVLGMLLLKLLMVDQSRRLKMVTQ
jgi:hypothetical protein